MSRKCLAFVEKFYELYAENKDYKTIAKEMDIPIRMVSKYLYEEVGIRETDYKGSLSAHVYYSDVNGKKNNKKFNFSTYGEDRAIILATEYVTQMKKLITEERTRLEQLKESMYGVC